MIGGSNRFFRVQLNGHFTLRSAIATQLGDVRALRVHESSERIEYASAEVMMYTDTFKGYVIEIQRGCVWCCVLGCQTYVLLSVGIGAFMFIWTGGSTQS